MTGLPVLKKIDAYTGLGLYIGMLTGSGVVWQGGG